MTRFQMLLSKRERSYPIYRLSSLTDGHSFFGHVCRLPKNTAALQALQLSIDVHTGNSAADWKRPPDRPRSTWVQQVEEDCRISVGQDKITHCGDHYDPSRQTDIQTFITYTISSDGSSSRAKNYWTRFWSRLIVNAQVHFEAWLLLKSCPSVIFGLKSMRI